jgi:hypothetical protein
MKPGPDGHCKQLFVEMLMTAFPGRKGLVQAFWRNSACKKVCRVFSATNQEIHRRGREYALRKEKILAPLRRWVVGVPACF